MYMSWKFLLFSLLVFLISTIDAAKRSNEVARANDSGLAKKPAAGTQQESAFNEAVQKLKRKKRIVAKRNVKTCDAKKESVLESANGAEQADHEATEPSTEELKSDAVEPEPVTEVKSNQEPAGDNIKVTQDGKRLRVRRYVKKQKGTDEQGTATMNVQTYSASATEQLTIEYPPSGTTLTANTTSAVYVTATPVTKSYRQLKAMQAPVTVTVVFNCTSGVFNVYVPLGFNTSFTVDPSVNGQCSVYATVPNNPSYLPSVPIIASIFTPLYFENLPSGPFYTGERFDVLVRPSNNAVLNLNVTIACRNHKEVISVTTTKPVVFYLGPMLLGNCTVYSDTELPYYKTFSPFEIVISPAIFFVRPRRDATFQAGADILVNLISTNLVTNLNVTVELYCNDVFVKSLTQDIQSTYVFTQNDQVHGRCLLAMADVDGYFTEQKVPITILQVLSFKSPTPNELIRPGTSYNILVAGNAPAGSVSVLVTGKCQKGGFFYETVQLGISKSVVMGSQFMGICTLTATADNFASSTVSILVFTPLTPEEIAAEARRLRLDGKIFEKTEPFLTSN